MIGFLGRHKTIRKIVFGMIGIAVLILVLALIVSALFQRNVEERYEISEGTVYDLVNWTNVLVNGTYMMYTVEVQDSGFCLRDKKMYDLARRLGTMKLHIDMDFQSIYALNIFDRFLCDPSTVSSKTYRVRSLRLSWDTLQNLTSAQWDNLQEFKDILNLPARPE